jgi:hypothetical protein
VTGYPRRKPNPIVELIRFVWLVVVAVAIAVGIGILIGMLLGGWWWELPILAVFGFFVYVLVRNRMRAD